MSIQLNLLLPDWLTWLLTAALFGAVVYGIVTMVQKQVARNWIYALGGLRIAAFLTFVLILLQPAITTSVEEPQQPEQIVLIDTSQSMGLASSKGTRLQEVVDALQSGEMAATLKSRYRIHWHAFDERARPIEERDLAGLKPIGTTTQDADSIVTAIRHARAQGKQPQRMLLVSDGLDRGDTDPVEIAREFGLTVDVLAPSVRKPDDSPPVAIAEVQSARRVLLGSDTTFRVSLDGRRPVPRDRSVQLRIADGGKTILKKSAVLKAGRAEAKIELTYRPPSIGAKQYEFSLSAGAAAGAKPYPVSVQVVDRKFEVLVLEDRWRWEYKFLHRLFEDDPSFRFSALLNRGGGAFVQFGSPDRRVNLIGFPQGRADLEGFDVFVLGDVNASKWPRGLANHLARLVADEGRSLVVIAGPGLANLRELPELHAILPVELTGESGTPIDGPIEVRLRADAVNSPFFFQLRNPDEKPTPLDQIYPTLRKRPGATVLLEAAKHRNPYGNVIVLAEQTVGRGRVLFVATDTLWKWHTLASTNDGPTPYSIFWQQAFRAMTPVRSNVGLVSLWLTPNRSRVDVGRPIVVQAEVESTRTLPPTTMQGFLTTPNDKRVPIVFSADVSNPRLYRAEFVCAHAGLNHISASLVAEGKALAEGASAVQVHEPRGEDGDVDLVNLARIAQATGGRVLDPAVPETWPTPGAEVLPPIERLHVIDPWGNFTLLLLLCVFLGIDWFIRLFNGLVSG